MTDPLRIAWLTTGRGPGSFGAFDYAVQAIADGLPVEVAVLFLNRDRGDAEATDRLIAFAEEHDVAVETLSSVAFRKARGGKLSRPGAPLEPWRIEYDAAVANRLANFDFDLGVMFGYMLIATAPLHLRFPFINDHPALPDGPIGTYQEVVRHLIASGATESGCMMNMVTSDVDRGPVLSFCRYPIRDADNERLWVAEATAQTSQGVPGVLDESPLFQDIRARGVRRERPFVVETLRELAEGRLSLPPSAAIDLTKAVEAAISRTESSATDARS
ncbi:MAG: formyltransferase family protein [Tepidiformaceae bacterium]